MGASGEGVLERVGREYGSECMGREYGSEWGGSIGASGEGVWD